MKAREFCEAEGHIWAPAGGGLYVCLRCEAEKWDEEELEDHLDEEYADWGGSS